MARRYTRDNRGRFASVGATARGGRLRTASGNKRETQTARFTGGNLGSTLAKPKGLKPQVGMSSRLKMRDPNSSLGKFAQRREQKAFMQKMAEKLPAPAAKPRQRLPLPKGAMKGTEAMKTHALITHAGQRKAARAESKALQAAGKTKPQVSTARKAATERLQIKTAARRSLRADRGSVVTPGQRSRLETGKGATMKGARPASTVAKPRTAGNSKQQVASRVERKLAATRSNLQGMQGMGRTLHQGTYERQVKSRMTLERAKNYLATGKLPGKDNSIKAQRAMRDAKQRLAATNAARKSGAGSGPTLPKTQKERWAARSAMLSRAAANNEAKAKRMFDAANTAGNTAFNTQPGRLAGRARMNAQTQRSFELQQKAAEQRSRAANLERLATTNKGDAAKGRARRADAVKASHKGLKKGDTIEGVLYGKREVVKVNAKSVTVRGGLKNFTIPWEFIKPKIA